MGKNIHKAGALGLLLQSGQIKPIDDASSLTVAAMPIAEMVNQQFQTQSGIRFSENELVYLDTAECEPWKYANRLHDDIGNLDDLINSIRENKQLQPVLVRPHLQPHGHVKYEVIFGRRRYLACKQLGIKLLAIKKNISDNQEAIAFQNAENRFRRDVSPYSNALHYQHLLNEGLFLSAKELANKLGISPASLNELLIYNKLPQMIIQQIKDIHSLSINMALCLHSICKQYPKHHLLLAELATQIGVSITSPVKLEQTFHAKIEKRPVKEVQSKKIYTSHKGNPLFTLSKNQKGTVSVILHNQVANGISIETLCEKIKDSIVELL